MAWPLLIAAIMQAIDTLFGEHVWAALPLLRQSVELAAGMTIISLAFVIAQALLFMEELWWRP